MLAPAHRGRIVAVEVLVLCLTSFDIKRLLIAVKTTRFDDGHFIAWSIEQNGTHSCWPTRVRLDPSLLRSDAGHTESGMRVIYRKSLDMGPKHMCLDELELICLRAPLPDLELGEDQCSWCLDVLLKLERLQCLAFGETFRLEQDLAEFQLIDDFNANRDDLVCNNKRTSRVMISQDEHISKHASVWVY